MPERCGEKSYTVGGNEIGAATMKNKVKFPQKKKKKGKKLIIELLYEAAIPLLSIYPDKIINKKYTHT